MQSSDLEAVIFVTRTPPPLTLTVYINSVHTSQETHHFTATKTSRLRLRGKIAVNHTLCGQNDVKLSGAYKNHWAVKGSWF
jgi:hypothetical protein